MFKGLNIGIFNICSSTCVYRFVVSNGKSSQSGSFELQVEMVDRVLPALTNNKGLRIPQGSVMILGPDSLTLSDPDTPPTNLTFVLTELPKYGRLLRSSKSLDAGSNFTQADINQLEVAYAHDGGPSQIDRFAFTASDSTNRGFLLDGQLQTEPVFFAVQVRELMFVICSVRYLLLFCLLLTLSRQHFLLL